MKLWRYVMSMLVLAGMGLLAGLMANLALDRAQVARTAQPAVIMEVFDPSLYPYSDMWRDEIARRFPHAVGVLVHGGEFVEGQWIVGSNLRPWMHVDKTTDLVERERAKYPDRTIVLVSCNPGHLKLGIPGVYYAESDVWLVPDRAITPDMYDKGTMDMTINQADDVVVPVREPTRWQVAPEVVGNIFEFVKD